MTTEFYYIIDKLHLVPEYVLQHSSTLCVRPSYKENPCTYVKVSVEELAMLTPLVSDFLLFVNPDPELRSFLTLLGLVMHHETNPEYIAVFNNVLTFGFSLVKVKDF